MKYQQTAKVVAKIFNYLHQNKKWTLAIINNNNNKDLTKKEILKTHIGPLTEPKAQKKLIIPGLPNQETQQENNNNNNQKKILAMTLKKTVNNYNNNRNKI